MPGSARLKSLNHRYPWAAPVLVVALALAALIVSERSRPVVVVAKATEPTRDNDVTAALYLLLRTDTDVHEVFVCPSSNAEKWDFGGGANTALNWSNWNSTAGVQRDLSYRSENRFVRRKGSSVTPATGG